MKLKIVALLAAVASVLAAASPALAETETETEFYKNIKPAVFTLAPVYFTPGDLEWADDIPFSGSHEISSFTFGYRAAESVRATFRFYGVDPATGNPGSLVAELSRELPAGEDTPTIYLDPTERFVFTAEDGLINGTSDSGGWFSVQFDPLVGTYYNGLSLRLAEGPSRNSFYNVTNGYSVATLDPSGLLPASFYLLLRSGGGDGTEVPAPQPAQVVLSPSTVEVGSVSYGTVILSEPAPAGGVVVELSTSRSRTAYPSPNQVIIPEGSDQASFEVHTRGRVGRRGVTVVITAEANGGTASTRLRVTR